MKPALMGLQGGYMEFTGVDDEFHPTQVRIQGRCVITGEIWSVVVKTEQMEEWMKESGIGGTSDRLGDIVYIQHCFPDLNADGCEWLISGISPPGWEETFG